MLRLALQFIQRYNSTKPLAHLDGTSALRSRDQGEAMVKRPDGPSNRPCESCKTWPTYRAVWQVGDRTEEHWFCPDCDAREADRIRGSGAGTRLKTHVPFAVEGLNDGGTPSGWFLEVTEVALVRRDGPVLHFKDDEVLGAALAMARAPVKLIATETVGEPRRHLTARFMCDEQGPTKP